MVPKTLFSMGERAEALHTARGEAGFSNFENGSFFEEDLMSSSRQLVNFHGKGDCSNNSYQRKEVASEGEASVGGVAGVLCRIEETEGGNKGSGLIKLGASKDGLSQNWVNILSSGSKEIGVTEMVKTRQLEPIKEQNGCLQTGEGTKPIKEQIWHELTGGEESISTSDRIENTGKEVAARVWL